VEISRQHLLAFLGVEDLRGKYLLDIGCGSGIHSLAALRAGAQRVVGFDADPQSVAAAMHVHRISGGPSNWEVRQGSVLDDGFVASLEPADIVYAWGVLHHTGDLWHAMRNAVRLVREGGLFYVALYEKTARSDHWTAVKRRYNAASWMERRRMELAYVYRGYFRTRSLRKVLTSLRYIFTYERLRGMAFWTDVRDWLGGWPYEPVTPAEVRRFCILELGLEEVTTRTGEANAEYLFARKAGASAARS
jgi:2-polyprenyl-3-methyl-5-hydroxy-6-metoxy-1,4-benzoquinol methylase